MKSSVLHFPFRWMVRLRTLEIQNVWLQAALLFTSVTVGSRCTVGWCGSVTALDFGLGCLRLVSWKVHKRHQQALKVKPSYVKPVLREKFMSFCCCLKRLKFQTSPQARSSHRFEGSNEPPSFAKFRFFFLVRFTSARLVLSPHDVSAAQTRKFGRTGLSTCARKPCVGRRHDLDWGVINDGECIFHLPRSLSAQCVTPARSYKARWNERRNPTWTDRPSSFLSVLVEGEAAINPSQTLLLLVHLSRFESLRPPKSRQPVSSKKNNALEVNLWLRPVLFPGSTTGAYLQGEVRARESQIRASSHIWRTKTELSTGASPSRSAFWTAASDSSRQNGWTSTNGLRTPHRRTEVSTMRSVSQKSWSRCWAVDHEAHDQLDKSFNNPEGARSQQNAQREC